MIGFQHLKGKLKTLSLSNGLKTLSEAEERIELIVKQLLDNPLQPLRNATSTGLANWQTVRADSRRWISFRGKNLIKVFFSALKQEFV